MLRVRNLESGYGKLKVLKGLSLHVKKGEIVTIIGANGKTFKGRNFVERY